MLRPIDSLKRWWTSDHLPIIAEAPAPAPVPMNEPAWMAERDRAGIPRTLVYPSTTLGRVLDQTADRFGDAKAVIFNNTEWTYRQLLTEVNRTAGGLATLGVRRGDRVLLSLPNCPEFVTCFFAIQKLGAIVVNVGPLMGPDDLQIALSLTSPRVAIGLDLQASVLEHVSHGSSIEHWVWVSLQGYQPMLRRLGYQVKLWHHRGAHNGGINHVALEDLLSRAPSRPPTIEPDVNSVAVLQATGGTTGSLKLAQLTHHGLIANATMVGVWMGSAPAQERCLAVLPMFHVYGLTINLLCNVIGANAMILMTRFAPGAALGLLRKHRATLFPLVPAICEAISNLLEREENPEPLDSLRLCFSGAAPLPASVGERFEKLTGATVIEGYGLTEASPVTHANLPGRNRTGSIGLPMPDTRMRVVDLDDGHDVAPGEAGEMLIAGPQVMLGYFGNAEATKQSLSRDAAGTTWLHTGDVVRLDEQGYTFVIDRKKDMIIRSGMKIYPGRVEHVLRMHKDVSDAGVVGRADLVHTESVVAVIVTVLPAPHREKLIDELRALCKEHLAPYEVPAEFEFRDILPRSALGKLLKTQLRERPVPEAPPADRPHKGNGHGPATGTTATDARLAADHMPPVDPRKETT